MRDASRGWLALTIAFAGWLLGAGEAHAAKSQQVVSFSEQRSIASTLWIPERLATVRGVLVLTGGQGENDRSGDTRGLTDSRFYQRFAESIGFAILGNQWSGSYTDAASGPGQALVDSLAQHAMVIGHPELAHAPLLLEGFSNGGFFSFTFAKWLPKRVIAFALNKSGFAKAQLDPEFAAVPGLFFWGEEELSKGLPTVIHSIVMQGRAAHALWAELKEWGKGHEEGDVERMFVPFFAEMVALRLPAKKTPPNADVVLNPLYEEAGWLGDHTDASIDGPLPTIASFAAYAGDKSAASWLPTEGLANLWRGYVTKQPFAIDLPVAHAQLSAAQALQLMASGLTSGELVSFFDGAVEIAKSLPANSGGEVRAQWLPQWGGGRGIVALVKTGGVAVQTSRPSVVVLYGKPPPKLAPPRKPPVPKTPPQQQGAQGAPAPPPPSAAEPTAVMSRQIAAPSPTPPPAATPKQIAAPSPTPPPAATPKQIAAPSPTPPPAATPKQIAAGPTPPPAATTSKQSVTAAPPSAAGATNQSPATAPPPAATVSKQRSAPAPPSTITTPKQTGPTPTPPPAASAPTPTPPPAATSPAPPTPAPAPTAPAHKLAPAPPPRPWVEQR